MCPMCNKTHPLYRCEVFKSKTPEARARRVRQAQQNLLQLYQFKGTHLTIMQLSLVERLRVKGSFSKLSVSTVNAKDVEKPGLKVDFKIAPIDDMNDQGIMYVMLGRSMT